MGQPGAWPIRWFGTNRETAAAIAVIEYQFITSKWKELDVDVAFGVYLLLLGGVAAAVSRFVPNQRIGQAPA